MSNADRDRPINIRIGHEELVIRQRYEAVGICNDTLIAVWFIVGSIMFFSPTSTTTGTWFFLLGSVQLLVRPVIRLTRMIHLQRIGNLPPGADHADQEF
ncbi:YrhK family protein [Spiractinospora alimapuensis]|uniref:YrhK family protein n=1 Tax=Spiractinospora alimapuensis TaxID=2820884 RepID=UPI001F1E3F7D|nr:YrhK family protein [Spiractinospora alimapuensis]QVQ50216.1 YrhK family protein [Spiractinospora alimapuensis]